MTVTSLRIEALPGLPLVAAGDDVARLILEGVTRAGLVLADHDVVVVAQKIVSKAEGRIVDLATVTPGPEAQALAMTTGKDARVVEVILGESRRVVRARPGLMIMEHRRGFVMANAGVDQSNVAAADGREYVLLLPADADASAAALRDRLERATGRRLAVIVNDSFGRAWRKGTASVAIGAAGLPSLLDLRGEPDLFGRPLKVTQTGFADEIAGAASLLMGQAAEGLPVVLVRGLVWSGPAAPATELIRPPEEDMFR